MPFSSTSPRRRVAGSSESLPALPTNLIPGAGGAGGTGGTVSTSSEWIVLSGKVAWTSTGRPRRTADSVVLGFWIFTWSVWLSGKVNVAAPASCSQRKTALRILDMGTVTSPPWKRALMDDDASSQG